jgi:hypothetical protein
VGKDNARPTPSFYLFLLGRRQISVEQPAEGEIRIRISDGQLLARSLGSPRHKEMTHRASRSKSAWTRP